MKVADLEGAALELLVARAFETHYAETIRLEVKYPRLPKYRDALLAIRRNLEQGKSFLEWAQAGPLIELHGISLIWDEAGFTGQIIWTAEKWRKGCMPSDKPISTSQSHSPTEAAMRCFIASTLGETVE